MSAYKSIYFPSVQLLSKQIWGKLTPALLSFSLRSNMLEPLALFHRKILKGILNLSQYAATPAIHFLLSELPIEGKIHRYVFSLFYSV